MKQKGKIKQILRARFKIGQNIEFIHRDVHGVIKPVFQPNQLFLMLKGLNKVSLFNRNPLLGSWQPRLLVSNLITDDGDAGAASRLNGDGAEAAFTYIAVGTGTTGANNNDSTLETELAADGLTRAAGSASRSTTDSTNDTAELTKTFSVTGTQAVTESGVLNASSDGVLLSRQTFAAINVINGDSLQITWKFDFD